MPAIMTQENGDVTTVFFTEGQILDELKIGQLNQELSQVAEKTAGGKLLLNFNDVHFMSSSVLGKLIALGKRCKEEKTELKMCNISPSIMEVFKITNLYKVFDIYEDERRRWRRLGRRRVFSRNGGRTGETREKPRVTSRCSEQVGSVLHELWRFFRRNSVCHGQRIATERGTLPAAGFP
jgi:anti-anti-sigma factor